MCTLAVFVGCSRGLPLVVAANRDEVLDRPTAEPAQITTDPWVVAGQDLIAGGTWFGLNQAGVIVGLLNRRGAGAPDPSRRSRGLLSLQMLQCRSIAEARRQLATVSVADYNPFNLLIADLENVLVATAVGDVLAVTPLPRGVHVLTNLELNDSTCPRLATASSRFRALTLPAFDGDGHAVVAPLHAVLAEHAVARPRGSAVADAVCVHRPGYGTRSSSIVVMTSNRDVRFWHAPGPPCRTAFRLVPLPDGRSTSS